MVTHRRLGALALAAASILVVAACAGDRSVLTAPTAPTTPTTPTTTTPPTTSRPTTTLPATTAPITTAPGSPSPFVADPNRPAQPYDEALAAALDDIQAYWRTTFPAVYGSPYREVGGGIWPVYRGRQNVPGCGQPTTRYVDIRGNAFYCPDGDFLAFDDTELFPSIYGQYGPVVLAMIVAHEWGHAIQTRAGTLRLPTIVLEQQADCFAGAWMGHLAAQGGPITVNDQTLEVAFAGMLSFRDALGTSSQSENAHGSGFDRVGAFQDGFLNGAKQCATYATSPPPVIDLPFQSRADAQNNGNLPYDQIVPDTEKDLDRFWKAEFATKGAAYAPPAADKPYPAAGPYPSCPSVATDPTFFAGRVWYCPDGDYVGYDQDALSGPVYQIGDFAVSVLLGNAWSDAMMDRLHVAATGKDRSLIGDCLTGAWTHSTLPGQATQSDQLVLSPGDLDEGVIAVLRFGEGPNGGEESANGTVFDRIGSFRRGVLQGISGCNLGS
jgi:predicted metalloprotease